jgi:hypothetical protein
MSDDEKDEEYEIVDIKDEDKKKKKKKKKNTKKKLNIPLDAVFQIGDTGMSGRGFIAKEDLPEGTYIASESPFCHTIFPSFKTVFCFKCFGPIPQGGETYARP